jgi:hypothetical protein
VTVRTPSDKKIAFCGKAGEGKDILNSVGRMENLDALESYLNKLWLLWLDGR